MSRRAGAAWLLAAACFGFAQRARAESCVPGRQTPCACVRGATGLQVCSESGTRYGPCIECSSPDAPISMLPAAQAPSFSPAPHELAAKRSVSMWATGLSLLVVGSLGVAAGIGVITAGAVLEGCDHTHGEPFCIGGS